MPPIDFDAEPATDAWDALLDAEPELARKLVIRSATGGALFDMVRPGWARMVRLDTLDMVSHTADIVAQVFGDCQKGLQKLSEPLGSTVPIPSCVFGLNIASSEQGCCGTPGCGSCGGATEDVVRGRFDALTALWIRMVKLRLEADRD